MSQLTTLAELPQLHQILSGSSSERVTARAHFNFYLLVSPSAYPFLAKDKSCRELLANYQSLRKERSDQINDLKDVAEMLSASGNSLRTFLFFLEEAILAILGSPGFPGALVGAKGWGKVVGFDCLILSQIGLILTGVC